MTLLNADFGRPALVHASLAAWVPSPIAGVERCMLDRIGDEVARATSLVRYAPRSQFSPHTHGGGEEFFVLEGVFQDERGDYPVGTYVRNPPGSAHTPASSGGCVILVKLWQFDPADRTPVVLHAGQQAFQADPHAPGVQRACLYHAADEQVHRERWAPGTVVERPLPGGAELLLLGGTLHLAGQTAGLGIDAAEALGIWSWLRLPAGLTLRARAGATGCELWCKTGHLVHPERNATAPTA